MEILYRDEYIAVCIKPAGVLSTDEPGGMPELLRAELGTDGVFTVHRLDRVVSGLMLFALSSDCASALSRQLRERSFGKEYLAVIHWRPREPAGTFRDLLQRDPAERKTHVVKSPGKGVQEAVLDYELMASASGMSLVKIRLHTGRTHQIRTQFSSRALPLVGDRKYSRYPDDCPIALWSWRLGFTHPVSGGEMEFSHEPPDCYPWNIFSAESIISQNI